MSNSELPRCDKCSDCEHALSKKYEGYAHWYKLNGRDVGQSHFGMNSPRCCPKRKINKENEVMNIQRLYLLTEDYRIVYIDHMCACDKCRERGETEIFIHGLDGSYVDCLKLNELNVNFKGKGILTCGNSIDEIMKWIKDFIVDRQCDENKCYQELNKLLNKQICEDEQKQQRDLGILAEQIDLLPDDVREKIKETVTRINQGGVGGLICILL